jgi:hypothetical protein
MLGNAQKSGDQMNIDQADINHETSAAAFILEADRLETVSRESAAKAVTLRRAARALQAIAKPMGQHLGRFEIPTLESVSAILQRGPMGSSEIAQEGRFSIATLRIALGRFVATGDIVRTGATRTTTYELPDDLPT